MYTILAVDDERWIRMGIVRMIDREANQIGEVYEAGTVREAIELYNRVRPDIVLTDVCFPAENGCTLGEYIFHDSPSVRIIMISAYSDFKYAQNALQFRANNYLLKPVSKERLNAAIADCVSELEQLANQDALPPAKEEPCGSAEIVQQIIRQVDADCSQTVSLSRLASDYHISEAYLSYVFRKLTGLSLTNYVAEARVEQACQLILMGKDKLRAIASRVGYDDYQYFVRVFKKQRGMTPSQYKSQARGGTEAQEDETPSV